MWCFHAWSTGNKAWHHGQNPEVLLKPYSPEEMTSSERKHVKSRVNHVLMHRNNEGTPEGHSGNQPACINRIHDKNSHGKNPTRYHSPAGKSSGHTYSRWCPFPCICRCVSYVPCAMWQQAFRHLLMPVHQHGWGLLKQKRLKTLFYRFWKGTNKAGLQTENPFFPVKEGVQRQ